MKILHEFKKEWEQVKEKVSGSIDFVAFVKIEADRKRKLPEKIKFLKDLMDDLNDNISGIEQEHYFFYTSLFGTKQHTIKVDKDGEPYDVIRYTKANYVKLVELLERQLKVYSYRDAVNELYHYWNDIFILNSDSKFQKITWLKKKSDLVDLFDELEKLGYIAYKKNKDEILRNHFTWVDGEIGKNDLKNHRKNLKHSPEIYLESDEMKLIKKDLKNLSTF